MSEKNIFARMSAITSELRAVAKKLKVDTGRGNSYQAVSERDILDAIKPLEAKHGVYSYPFDRQIVESANIETESEYKDKVTKRITYFSRMRTIYRFVNIDDPSDWMDTVVYSEGIDSQDKGSGKAMTYADKYALMKAYKISTGNDPDRAPSPEKPGYYMPPEGDSIICCQICSSQIMDYWDGKAWVKAKRLAARSSDLHSKVLCPECMKLIERKNRETS